MPMHFRNSPVNEPFIFDSIGNRWSQDRVLRPNGYPLYHYLQTEKGRGIVELQGKTYTLDEGEGILIAPYLHHTYMKAADEWMTSFATFTGTIDSSIAKIVGNRQVVLIEKDQGILIGKLLDSIMDEWDTLSCDTRTLSIRCYCLLMYFTDSMYAAALSREPLYLRYVEPVIKEIETHFDSSELTAAGLSSQVFITPQYLSRLFRKFLGCSVYEYLTTYRINRAREFLVSDPRMEVQKIARLTGFSDTSHFIAMFKKATGVTPLEFRRLN
ncbi:MAG: AraC family transcriptional regulator [Dorea sp.]|nr:AraC family transcriptional regulator [Dorea sp.]